MNSTNTMLHFDLGGGIHPGSGSVLGLPIVTDDEGGEFVYYKDVLTHIDEVPLPRLHREEMGSGVPKPKRVPVVATLPLVPPVAAFARVTGHADTIHPDSPVLEQ
jgi:hypothetical protein